MVSPCFVCQLPQIGFSSRETGVRGRDKETKVARAAGCAGAAMRWALLCTSVLPPGAAPCLSAALWVAGSGLAGLVAPFQCTWVSTSG